MNNKSIIKTILKLRNEAKKFARTNDDQLSIARSFVAGIIVELYSPTVPYQGKTKNSLLSSELIKLFTKLDIDTAAYFIGTIYTAMLPVKYRSEYGVYYTPPALTERLLDMTEDGGVDWGEARIVDPACGGGAFLAPIARRILKKINHLNEAEKTSYLKVHLHGFEIDPFSAWMSKVFLEISIKKECKVSSELLNTMISVCDSLKDTEKFYSTYDLVIGNPPYGKIKLDVKERKAWSRSLYGHTNLYTLFTDLGLRLSKNNAIVAFVTPTSFLGGQYFKALRSLLSTTAHPLEINFISRREGVFADALQETLLSVYKLKNTDSPVNVKFLDVKEDGILKIKDGGSYRLPENKEAPWILPRAIDQIKIASLAQNKFSYLKNLGYKVSTGPLVWNRNKEKLKIKKLKRCIPVIWAESIKTSGNFKFSTKGKNHSSWYISTSEERDPNIIKSSCILLQRTSSIEQKRRLVSAVLPQDFIDNSGGSVVIENHINMIKPIKNTETTISMETLTIFLNSIFVDKVFRCINGSTAVSAYELESMPIPSPQDFIKFEHLIIDNKTTKGLESLIEEMYFNVDSEAVANHK